MSISQFPFLYSDNSLVVVDKPSGVLSHPNPSQGMKNEGGKSARAVFEGAYDSSDRRFDTPEGPVWLIHRLDKDTSGAILGARDKSTAEGCRKLFEEGRVRKKYLALLVGRPFPLRGIWRDHVVEKKKPGSVRAGVSPGEVANSELKYSVIKTFTRDALSLVEIELITGKTHQIRVQSSFRKCPVAGDEVYGNFSENRKLRKSIGLKRLFLHAHNLKFKHPRSGVVLEISSPVPSELESVLNSAK